MTPTVLRRSFSLRYAGVNVVTRLAGTRGSPEALFFALASSRLPRAPVLPFLIKELHEFEPGCRPGHRRPSTRDLVGHVPSTLAIRVSIAEPSQTTDDTAHA